MDIKKSTNNRQYLGSTADFAKNLISAVCASRISNEPLKLYNVDRSIFFLCSTKEVYNGKLNSLFLFIYKLFLSS